ncbi:tetratricopeptide repeat protein [Limibaculum sp. M0105]|uniref:Tetratricopeptide repeat protein n=1 Tax=Thermohalobaculum xanthum TaxID=2753746 RepID=A0A8J7SJI1_9RHOB|nr:adenylate/guanylate cyclase domain-containing protein [Thermohalobaculum xanthum]MBK0400985.1 tetratricopeptide repeat protein [Thermohalobaculum xanthum]
MERKLAVILAADVAGYSRLVASDEEATLAALTLYRKTIDDLIAEHEGRIFSTAGDSVVAEFASAVLAVRAAVAIQRALHRRNADLAPDRRLEWRIGLHLGDVVIQGADLLGDGVNVAARLQEVAQPAGICVSGPLREQIDGRLEFRLTAIGERSLKNISRSIAVHRVDWQRQDPVAAGALGGPLALPDKPSIAVLPFANMSDEADQEYFADGLTEDIITALSRYRWFFVIARNSSFAYKGRSMDVKQIARELGVRYVLEGSVRKAADRLRVTGQLIDAETAAHIWAERYDRNLADIFDIQDELTQQVVGAIEPEILMGEGRRVSRKPTANLDAYECHMRGMWFHNPQMTADQFTEAIRWQRKAIELDPSFARAHMALARSLYARFFFGHGCDFERDGAELQAAAARAVALDDRDPYSYYASFTAYMFAGRPEMALAEAQRAIDLNPNFALGHMALGWSRVISGHFAEALDPLHTALRLSPNDPLAYLFLNWVALAHYHLGNYEEAAHHSGRANALRKVPPIRVVLLASLGQLGRTEEAKVILSDLAESTGAEIARYLPGIYPYADPADRTHLYEGLRKAGLDGVL